MAFRRALRPLALAAGNGIAAAAAYPAFSEQSPPPAKQWCWTFDGVTIRRDDDGQMLYYDAAGNELPSRPESLPKEAYAHRWRFPPNPDWDAGKSYKPKGPVRHVFLLRHSQYNMEGKGDTQRTLTEKGEEQAKLLGKRLASIHAASDGAYKDFSLETLKSSMLTRAIQTADIIAPLLPSASYSVRDATLNEGRPCLPEPPPKHAPHYTRKNDGERIESAYRLVCSRPTIDQKEDSCEIIVCHANVIRYVVCRALQLPPEAWLRFSLPHASMTHLVIRPGGEVTLRSLGDVGHLPAEMVTY